MPVKLNHTIVHARDAKESATFVAELLGLPAPRPLFHFWVVECANEVSLDFLSTEDDIASAHYAFLVSEAEFDEIFGRIQQRGLPYWADPMAQRPGEIYRHHGGRGVYFGEPAGNYLEILTRPYA